VKFNVLMRSEKIPLDVSVCLYAWLEALRNISRHSNAPPPGVTDRDCDSLTAGSLGSARL